MWDSDVSIGCVVMYALWGAAFGLIGFGWSVGELTVENLGLALSALAAALTVMKDNQRTRQALRRWSPDVDDGQPETLHSLH